MPRIKLNSISLNYELDGEGPVLVFINGLTMDINGWYFQVSDFSNRYRMLRYDCRGQGKSDIPEPSYSQEMHAEDLRSLMDKLKIQKAHLVGLSNGGMIAQHFVLRYPDKVGALVLVDTCSYIDTLLESIIKIWIKSTQTGGSELRYDISIPFLFSEEFIRTNNENISAMKQLSVETNPPHAIINLANACLRHNVNDRLSEIKSPTLIIVGGEDILIPLKYSKLLHEKINKSELVIMKECGHVPPIENPKVFNSIVLEFLKDKDSLIQ